jgi:hypothetical protein
MAFAPLTWPLCAVLVSSFALVLTWQFGGSSLVLSLSLSCVFVWYDVVGSALFPKSVDVWVLGVGPAKQSISRLTVEIIEVKDIP